MVCAVRTLHDATYFDAMNVVLSTEAADWNVLRQISTDRAALCPSRVPVVHKLGQLLRQFS